MRLTVPRVVGAAAVLLLAGYVFGVAPRLHGGAGAAAAAAPFPPPGTTFVGISTSQGPSDYASLDAYTKAVGRAPSVFEFFEGWADNSFDAAQVESVARRGMLPMITWEPWNHLTAPKPADERGDEPAYRLSRIVAGDFDAYIRAWALGVKKLGFTIAIRFAQEMNGNWYPWCEQTNGNAPGQYVQAWRHVHDIFREVGADNVIWVWSPNVLYPGSTSLAELYPGNAYVDWIGLSGYYGNVASDDNYASFDQIFDPTIADLRSFTDKPIVIAETAATDQFGLMAKWVTEMFAELPAQHDVIGVIWYEADVPVDLQLADHPAAAAAFARGLADARYQVRWRPTMSALQTVPPP